MDAMPPDRPRWRHLIALASALALLACLLAKTTSCAPCAGPFDLQRSHCLSQAGGKPPSGGGVKVTFFGVSTLLFDDGKNQVMIDGFFSRLPLKTMLEGPVSTDKAAVDAALARGGVGKVDGLFVAHSHYDHAFDVAYVAEKTGATIHGSRSTWNIAAGGNVPESRRKIFKAGQRYGFGKFTVIVLDGRHSPPITGINDDLGQTIDEPLAQPADRRAYKEGGAYDFLIEHEGRSILVIPSTNYRPGSLDGVKADVLFLSTATLGIQTEKFREDYYENTAGRLRPQLVIPIHWDNFFLPLSDELTGLGGTSFGFLERRLKKDGIRFGILQGFQSTILFEKPAAEAAR